MNIYQDQVLDEVGDTTVGNDEESGDGSGNSRGVSVLLGVDFGGLGESGGGAVNVSGTEIGAVAGGGGRAAAAVVVVTGSRAGDQLKRRTQNRGEYVFVKALTEISPAKSTHVTNH